MKTEMTLRASDLSQPWLNIRMNLSIKRCRTQTLRRMLKLKKTQRKLLQRRSRKIKRQRNKQKRMKRSNL